MVSFLDYYWVHLWSLFLTIIARIMAQVHDFFKVCWHKQLAARPKGGFQGRSPQYLRIDMGKWR